MSSAVLSSVATTSWKAYYCLEVLPGITPTNPAFIFLTNLTSFSLNPAPKYKDNRSTGLLPATTTLMSVKPVCKLSIQISDLGVLTDLVQNTTSQTATICFRNESDGIFVVMRGITIDSCTIKAINDSDSFVEVQFDITAATISSSATAIAGARFAQPPKNSFVIPVQNVQIRNVGVIDPMTGSDAIQEWKVFELFIKKKLLRRINAVDGSTRAIAHVSSTVALNLTRSMMASDAIQQQSDIIAGTAATIKIEILSYPNSWSATLSGARPSAIVQVSSTKDADGHDSEAIYKYSANGIAYSNVVSIVLTPPDATVSQVGLSGLFTETWGEPAEPVVGQPPSGAVTAVPALTELLTEHW